MNKKIQLRKEFEIRMWRSKERYRLEQIEKARRMFDQEQAILRTLPQSIASANRHDLKVREWEKEDKKQKLRFKEYILSRTEKAEDQDTARRRLIDEGYKGINWD